MFRKLAILLLFIAAATTVSAQHRHTAGRSLSGGGHSAVVQAYTDSLTAARARLDSLFASGVHARQYAPSQLARLFLPTTFYSDIPAEMLSLRSSGVQECRSVGVPHSSFLVPRSSYLVPRTSLLSETLMSIYLRRPDLVQTTSAALDVIGPVIDTEAEQQQPASLTINTQITAPQPVEITPAAVAVVVKKPNFWAFSADTYMQFIQNYISDNWYKGGQSNYSMVSSLTLQANYNNKQKVKWDNKLEMKLGFQTQDDDTLHRYKTSEDLLRYTGKLGLQATRHWYYTLQTVASTQFLRGYNKNNPAVFSDFASPFNLNISLGMDYSVSWFKGKVKGSVHLAPLAYNFRYVSRKPLAARYGVRENHHSLSDKGSTFTIDLTAALSPSVRWKTRMYGYTTYERAELEWENTVTLQLNRYISTNIFLYPRFDDGTARDRRHGYFQFKEYASVGLSYSF